MSFQKNCQTAVETLSAIRIVPVLVLNDVDSGLKMCEVLAECGLPAAEITFRTTAAEAVIKAASERFPELYLGAGTVLNSRDLHRAFDAGAKFAVAPGFNPTCTPSEVEQAMEYGCRFLKFFPAEASGGINFLKSLIAPYKHMGVRFMPTGGVTTANVADYLAVKEIVAVGGTWLGKSSDIESGNWDAIRTAVKAAVELSKNC